MVLCQEASAEQHRVCDCNHKSLRDVEQREHHVTYNAQACHLRQVEGLCIVLCKESIADQHLVSDGNHNYNHDVEQREHHVPYNEQACHLRHVEGLCMVLAKRPLQRHTLCRMATTFRITMWNNTMFHTMHKLTTLGMSKVCTWCLQRGHCSETHSVGWQPQFEARCGTTPCSIQCTSLPQQACRRLVHGVCNETTAVQNIVSDGNHTSNHNVPCVKGNRGSMVRSISLRYISEVNHWRIL
jgi:hypothetical protein